MSEHLTHVLTYKNKQHAYCTCDWNDLWLPNDGTAYESAATHKHEHEES